LRHQKDQKLDEPRPAQLTLKTDTFVGFVVIHLLALLAVLPWFFSWTGVVLLGVGMYVFGVLGVNLGFHRLMTHRGFACPLWLERTLVLLGTCSLQFSPAYWIAIHRRHHHFADKEQDPHSPLVSFLWSHFGWLLMRAPDMKPAVMIDRYARDVMRDPVYALLERKNNWIFMTAATWVAIYTAGFGAAFVSGRSFWPSVQFGLSLFVWGCALRTVLVWHTTWAVNSVTHIWGYRNYDTPDDSRNNAIVALLAGGEGWHNNHHADPTSARHGHTWWEIDLAWLTIRGLMQLGLATKVALPSPSLARPAAPPA